MPKDVRDPDNKECRECLCLECIYAPCEDGCPCDQKTHIVDCISFNGKEN